MSCSEYWSVELAAMELGWSMMVLWAFTQLISSVVLFYSGDETLVIPLSSLIPLLPSVTVQSST